MKLAEALIDRGSTQKQIDQLQERLKNVALIAEGTDAAESPSVLIAELEDRYAQLQTLIQRINRTNAAKVLPDGTTLTDLLATRDVLKKRYLFLHDFANAAVPKKERFSAGQVRYKPSVDVTDIRRQADSAAAEFRRVELRVQALNWEVDVIE